MSLMGAKEARADSCFSSSRRHFITSPIDTMPVSRLSSTTDTCRNFAAVVRAIVPITVSFMPQVATYRTRGNNTAGKLVHAVIRRGRQAACPSPPHR